MNEFEPNDDDVLYMEDSFVGHPTHKVSEVTNQIRIMIEARAKSSVWKWIGEGVQCQIMRTTAAGWQTGKLRIRLEFIPDEPAVLEQPAVPEILEGHERLLQ